MPGLKLAIVSNVLPPSWSGQAMVLHRFLAEIDPDRYCLISRQDYREDKQPLEEALRLPGNYHHLPPELQFPTGQRFGVGRVTAAINPWIQTHQRARSLSVILQRERCGMVIACTGDLVDPPASFLASRRHSIPFYLHAFDDYIYQWTDPRKRTFAKRAERNIMKRGAGVITPNEFLRDAYAKRHTIEPILIRNPSLAMGDEDLSVHSWPAISNEIRIVYTGAVYHAHHDAFRNLVTAIALSEDATLQLHIHTAQTHEQLAKEGIEGPVRMGEHLKPSEVRIVQQQADILFLPLSFESPIQEVVRTSAPGKMGEYLASGRPVLVHAPADSYVSWYFRLHACGVVVDENSPHALLAGIRSIVEDTTLRKRIIGNAREAADRDFSLPAARAAYWRLFEIS